MRLQGTSVIALSKRSVLASGVLAVLLHAPAPASEAVTEQNVITGTMEIQFQSRVQLDESGFPMAGAKDEYRFTFNVAKTTEFAGTITRQPRIIRSVIGSEIQPAQLQYDVNLAVLNPTNLAQKRNVGKWVGIVPIEISGAYNLAGGKESALRIVVDTLGKAQGFRDSFGGKLVGKPKEKRGGAMSFMRRVAGKEVKIQVTNSDPMRFEGMVIAAGPSANYPRSIVNGNLDYDYDTGNWYTNGIRFRYALDGTDIEDVVTGSIKWVEDPNREQNGKGHYEFNLRFNEEKNQKATGEADAFKGLSDEEAFFAVDTSMPSLTGTIDYEDSMIPGRTQPAASKIRYVLHANKLTKQQVLNFFKLWMVCVGPTNDE